ncbi:hypothetical protein D3C87_207360 [compost metagenome]
MTMKHLLVVAICLMGCSKANTISDGDETGDPTWGQQPALPVVEGTVNLNMTGDEHFVNAMSNAQPRIPNFPALTVKPNVLSGYVADLAGKPLKGAYIGVRVTAIGGSYTSVQAETNDKGYYEMSLPIGGCSYFANGYVMDYNGTQTVVGLRPSDGKMESFASGTGAVKNFIMQSYGPADPDDVSAQPQNSNNYYGGAIYFSYNVDWDSNLPNNLPKNGEIQIELIPDGKGIFGENRTFKVTKQIGYSGASIVNIPVGRYTIKVKLKDNRELKLKEVGPYANNYPALGLLPKVATGSASVLFIPEWQKTKSMVSAYKGNWMALNIGLSL